MGHDVFIGHETHDSSIAGLICEKLESRNISCWIEPRDIRPGESYAQSLIRAIDQSKIFIFIFSSRSNNSPLMLSQLQRAFNRNLTVIPFGIEKIQPSESVQFFLGSQNWLDASSPPMDNHIDKLVETTMMFLKTGTYTPGIVPSNDTGGWMASASYYLGYAGLIAWLIPICGYIVTISGWLLGREGMKTSLHEKAKKGMKFSKIGFILTFINSIFGVLMGLITSG